SGPEVSLSDTTSCPDASPPVSGTANAVARFSWTSTDSDGSTDANIVNYVRVGTSLLRRQCFNGTLVTDRAVASSVLSVSVACSPTTNCTGTPTSISITVTETVDSNGTSYSYTVTGTFRKLIATGPPTNPKSMILLGASTTCSGTTNTIDIQGGTMH